MKNFILIGFSLCIYSIASAVPQSMYLASPKKIEVLGKKVALTFALPCSNDAPDEWAGNLIAVSDDDGDMVVGLGVALSKDSCKAGPIKEFTFKYQLSKTGLTKSDLKSGASFEPIDLAQ